MIVFARTEGFCMGNAKVTGNIIGERLQEARIASGLDQAELAAELSIALDVEYSAQVISKMERGMRAVRDKELKTLADILKVEVGALFD